MVLVTKFIFSIWWFSGKLIGLFPVYFDKNSGLFVSAKALKVYGILLGIVIIILQPFALSRFLRAFFAMNQIENSLSENISLMGHRTYQLFLIMLYLTYSFRSHMLVDILNKAKVFIERFAEQYPDIVFNDGLDALFAICVCLKFWKAMQYGFSTIMIMDTDLLSVVELIIINFPQLTFFIVFSQFFLGILFLRRYLSQIRIIIETLVAKQQTLRGLREALHLSEELDALSLTFNELYEFFVVFQDFHSVFMTYMVYEFFQGFVLICYYQLVWYIEFFFCVMATVYFSIPLMLSIIFALISIDLLLYCESSAIVDYEVRFGLKCGINVFILCFQFIKIQQTILSLNVYQQDKRLVSSVSCFK